MTRCATGFFINVPDAPPPAFETTGGPPDVVVDVPVYRRRSGKTSTC